MLFSNQQCLFWETRNPTDFFCSKVLYNVPWVNTCAQLLLNKYIHSKHLQGDVQDSVVYSRKKWWNFNLNVYCNTHFLSCDSVIYSWCNLSPGNSKTWNYIQPHNENELTEDYSVTRPYFSTVMDKYNSPCLYKNITPNNIYTRRIYSCLKRVWRKYNQQLECNWYFPFCNVNWDHI